MGMYLTDADMRSLKGVPGNILLFFILRFINGQTEPVSQRYIQQMTGYSDTTVEKGLLYLFSRQMVVRIDRYSWVLAANNISQLPLMASLLVGDNICSEDIGDPISERKQLDTPETRKNSVSGESAGESDILRVHEDVSTGIRDNSVSEEGDTEILRINCPSSSRYINNLDKKIKQQLLELEESELLRVVENLQTCEDCGITEPAKTRLSLLRTTTPNLIRYHCQTLKDSDTLGLAIYRIEKNWRISDRWLREHSKNRAMHQANEWVESSFTITSNSGAGVCQEKLEKVLESVRSDFSKAPFETWIKPLRLDDVQEGEWTITVYNQYAGKWILEHALEKIESAAGVRIKLMCDGKLISD